MEQIIVMPASGSRTIAAESVARVIEEDGDGLIFVYHKKGGDLVGSVIPYNGEWILSTFDEEASEGSLLDLLEDNYGYEYRYITK